MSRHHYDKEYYNRLARRASKHDLHLEQVDIEDENDPDYGTFLLRDVQTGAVTHQTRSDGNRDYEVGLRQIEDYLDKPAD